MTIADSVKSSKCSSINRKQKSIAFTLELLVEYEKFSHKDVVGIIENCKCSKSDLDMKHCESNLNKSSTVVIF